MAKINKKKNKPYIHHKTFKKFKRDFQKTLDFYNRLSNELDEIDIKAIRKNKSAASFASLSTDFHLIRKATFLATPFKPLILNCIKNIKGSLTHFEEAELSIRDDDEEEEDEEGDEDDLDNENSAVSRRNRSGIDSEDEELNESINVQTSDELPFEELGEVVDDQEHEILTMIDSYNKSRPISAIRFDEIFNALLVNQYNFSYIYSFSEEPEIEGLTSPPATNISHDINMNYNPLTSAINLLSTLPQTPNLPQNEVQNTVNSTSSNENSNANKKLYFYFVLIKDNVLNNNLKIIKFLRFNYRNKKVLLLKNSNITTFSSPNTTVIKFYLNNLFYNYNEVLIKFNSLVENYKQFLKFNMFFIEKVFFLLFFLSFNEDILLNTKVHYHSNFLFFFIVKHLKFTNNKILDIKFLELFLKKNFKDGITYRTLITWKSKLYYTTLLNDKHFYLNLIKIFNDLINNPSTNATGSASLPTSGSASSSSSISSNFAQFLLTNTLTPESLMEFGLTELAKRSNVTATIISYCYKYGRDKVEDVINFTNTYYKNIHRIYLANNEN